ncbi:hypothetical protein [Actinobaculum suis]|uniref:hypothetical protein n=1 Tax=Actinobaculum suis TaxID=1657 RepID=UPI00159ECA06|nr:hypothetical protein [Actinobaculum suis]
MTITGRTPRNLTPYAGAVALMPGVVALMPGAVALMPGAVTCAPAVAAVGAR